MFNKYVSNVSCGTGTNYILNFGKDKKITARAFFKVERHGRLNYRFFFQNTVNTTFAQGEEAYVDLSGGCYKILSARVGIGSEYGDYSAPASYTDITFNGNKEKTVQPDECYWSDETQIDVPDGRYLVWEWVIEGDMIPCTPDSQIPTFIDFGEGFTEYHSCPMPALIGCDKNVRKRIAFVGDSITQGCGTTFDKYDMWVGRIGKMLKDEYAVWNLGLGFSRGSDAANMGSLMRKAKENDIVVLTYGVNDLLSGKYKAGKRSSAGELLSYIEAIIKELQSNGVEVILSTIPPFRYDTDAYYEWRCINMAIPQLADIYGCRVFDFEGSLDESPVLENKYMYGEHPNGEGGYAAAEKFRSTFYDGKEWSL